MEKLWEHEGRMHFLLIEVSHGEVKKKHQILQAEYKSYYQIENQRHNWTSYRAPTNANIRMVSIIDITITKYSMI